MRHELVQRIVKAYADYERKRQPVKPDKPMKPDKHRFVRRKMEGRK